jgi:hypothetical protein
LDEGDDPRLRFTVRALQGIDLVYALYACGPTTFAELLPMVALLFFSRRRGELRAFASASAGIPPVVSCDAF